MQTKRLFLISLIAALALVVGYAPKVQAQITTPVFNLGSLPENICKINGEAQITTWYVFGNTMGLGFLNADGQHQLNIYSVSALGITTLQSSYLYALEEKEPCADYGLNVSIGPVYLSGQMQAVPVTPEAYPEPEITSTPDFPPALTLP